MTGAEIIKLIQEKGLEDYKFAVQYRDEGGDYAGKEMIEGVLEVYEEDKIVIL